MHISFNIYNESLRNKLKGKSEDDILANSKDLSSFGKMEKGCQYGILFLVKQSIEEGLEHFNLSFGFELAAAYGHLEIIKYLLNNTSLNPNSLSLIYASDNGHLNVVKFLIKDDRIDPSADNNHALRRSIENGYKDIRRLLLKNNDFLPFLECQIHHRS